MNRFPGVSQARSTLEKVSTLRHALGKSGTDNAGDVWEQVVFEATRWSVRQEADGEKDGGSNPEPESSRYRAVFISDLHLGTPGCQAGPLLDFLRSHTSDSLYLVGDIIDGWQLRRRWYWPQLHNDVVQKLLRRARKGCRVVLVPGNHDEFARAFVGLNFGGIEVLEDAVHRTADGKRLWVTHGDYFDGVIQCAKWLAYVGDHAYEMTLRINRHVNSLRARMGMPYWSLSAYLKHKVKKAVNYVSDFEGAVASEARRRGGEGGCRSKRASMTARRKGLFVLQSQVHR